eukprot:355265-Chlamydomonas_euryale.AAC.16
MVRSADRHNASSLSSGALYDGWPGRFTDLVTGMRDDTGATAGLLWWQHRHTWTEHGSTRKFEKRTLQAGNVCTPVVLPGLVHATLLMPGGRGHVLHVALKVIVDRAVRHLHAQACNSPGIRDKAHVPHTARVDAYLLDDGITLALKILCKQCIKYKLDAASTIRHQLAQVRKLNLQCAKRLLHQTFHDLSDPLGKAT